MRNLLVFVALVALAGSAYAQAQITYLLAEGYQVTIDGTSNLHDWDERVETVRGSCGVVENADGSYDLNLVSLQMEVQSIQSEKGSLMDNKTYEALKSDRFPEITFRLESPIQSILPKGTVTKVIAKGKLTIAGVSNHIAMEGEILILGKGRFAFEGSKTVKMTDYGVDPPKALLGTLKTGDEITIHLITSFYANN